LGPGGGVGRAQFRAPLPQVVNGRGERRPQILHGERAYRLDRPGKGGNAVLPTRPAKAGELKSVGTSSPGRRASYSYQRPSWRRPLIVLGVVLVIVGLIAVGAFAPYNAYQRYVQRLLT